MPALRERGFKGSFPHFRRPTEHAIDLLTFQFDKYGGGFVVELATCPPHGIETSWGEHIPPSKVKAWDASRRLRLGARDEQSDGIWFRYDRIWQRRSEARFDRTAVKVLRYLADAEAWWEAVKSRALNRGRNGS